MKSRHSVGRASHLVTDTDRDGRHFGVEVWYPLAHDGGEPMMYELLPGVGFFGAAVAGGEAAPGALPVVIVSHGHTGTRLVYSQLCEALAREGYVVVSLDHPGDTMADVILGAGVDEATNIEMRVADLHCLYELLIGRREGLNHGLTLDTSRVHALGHSFGAYAVVEWASRGGAEGTLASVIALQPYLVPMTPAALQRVTTPLLLVAGEKDQTTPVSTNVMPALEHLPSEFVTAVVLDGVGHQGCSDVGLYIETAPTLPGVPAFVLDFLRTMDADTTGVAGEPWRPVAAIHASLVAAWLSRPGDVTVVRSALDGAATYRIVTSSDS